MPFYVTVLRSLGKGLAYCATELLPVLELTGQGLACLLGALVLGIGFPLLENLFVLFQCF